MTRLNENSIEQSFIGQLVNQDYTYLLGSDIAENRGVFIGKLKLYSIPST